MDFGVLGPLEVSRDGAPVRIGSRMQRRLLALLLIHAGTPVDADLAVDVLWAGAPPPSATKGLQTYVSRLRRLLGEPGQIESDVRGYRLHLDGHGLDARRFERLVGEARGRLDDDAAGAAADLSEALALWRGAAYAEVAHEDFARPEAVRLDELRLEATEEAFRARLAAGDLDVVPDLEAFVATHPLRERPHAHLMTALSRAGRLSDALEVYRRFRARLADELGLEPSATLQQLQADVLHQVPSVASASGTQVRAVAGAPLPSSALPRPVTSFVGRRHESRAVGRLLERGRLVTLTGVGGVGKTRLALQAAAAHAQRFPDGVWWCELAPVDTEAVSHAVAGVLGVPQHTNRSIDDSVVAALEGKQGLIVLDNCEHVVAACARFAGYVLRRCPGITILATSREPLTVDGEQIWSVPPLPLPAEGGEDGEGNGAVRLFTDRAAAHLAATGSQPADPAAIADICRQLDGLPLAIELAAALVPALAPAEIARRLGHRFRLLTHGPRADPRHRSLAAVVDWSYQLLDPSEQLLFDRLAVFSGGFSLSCVEGVCADAELPTERIAGLLAGLVSRSMVRVDRSVTPVRYDLLETLRQYAAERLRERGAEAALLARHASWYVELAERADVQVRGPNEAAAVALLESELANLRMAHRWAYEHDDADLALRLAAALYFYASFRLRDEVFLWAQEAAALPSAAGHPLLPNALGAAAHGASNRGELGRARELAERGLAAASDRPGQARWAPMRVLATIALYEGRLEECQRLGDEAIRSASEHDDPYHRVWMRIHNVLPLVYGGRRAAALDAARHLRSVTDELGNPNLRAWARYVHAEACGDDDPDTALHLLEAAVALAAPIRGRYLEGVASVAMASLRARHRSPTEALATFAASIDDWRRLGDWTHQWTTLRNLVPLLVRVGADEPAVLLDAAQRAAGADAPAFGEEAGRLDRARRTLEERCGTGAFNALSARGARLRGEQAVELALDAIAEVLARPPAPVTHDR